MSEDGDERMRHSKRYICIKCGKSFTKMAGGVIMPPKELELTTRPVCDKCKLNKIADILGLKK